MLSNPSCNHGGPQKFMLGGGGKLKKGPHHKEKVAKSPPHGEKALKNEKNVAKWPPYEEKVAKRPPIYFFKGGGGVGGGRLTLAGAHACNRVALMITISCKKVNINQKN